MTEREALASKKPFLVLRSNVLQAIRTFFLGEDFIEIQTPVRTPTPAPEQHIEAVPADGWFLSTSPELYMKRLLASGYERIFQIAPAFRRGEHGKLHHPEFIMLEWYRLESDYEVLKQDCRNLLTHVCRVIDCSANIANQNHFLTVEGDWQHLTVREAFLRFASWDPVMNYDPDRFDVDLVDKVEPRLGFPRPCILSDYPIYQAALARSKPGNPTIAERFELYWAGIELANGFSELNDPHEQRSRFLEALDMRHRDGKSVYPLPEKFLESLEFLPSCAGIALGIDRLVMMLSGANQLDHVVAFPPELA